MDPNRQRPGGTPRRSKPEPLARLGSRPRSRRTPPEAIPTTPYRADAFALALPNGWSGATIHTLAGPQVDGLPHTLTVASAPHRGLTLRDYARAQTADVLAALPAASLLLEDDLVREDGTAAARAIFRWSPTPGRTLYHQQVHTLAGENGVTLAMSFTRRSRDIVGAEALRLALSLTVT